MSGITKARRDIYDILRGIAVSQSVLISYSELSERLKDRPDPHRGLSRLLDDLKWLEHVTAIQAAAWPGNLPGLV